MECIRIFRNCRTQGEPHGMWRGGRTNRKRMRTQIVSRFLHWNASQSNRDREIIFQRLACRQAPCHAPITSLFRVKPLVREGWGLIGNGPQCLLIVYSEKGFARAGDTKGYLTRIFNFLISNWVFHLFLMKTLPTYGGYVFIWWRLLSCWFQEKEEWVGIEKPPYWSCRHKKVRLFILTMGCFM